MADQLEKALIQKKAKALWSDKRSYTNRLLLAGAAVFAACFTFIFFGPFEMVAFGVNSLEFTYKDVTGLLLAAMTVSFVCGTLAIALLRGKIFNYVVTVVFSVTVAGYLQAAFFNGSVGALTGEIVEWSKMKLEMIISLLAWVTVFIVTITVLYFHRAFWRNMVIGVSAMLVFMQLTPMVGIFLGAFRDARIPDRLHYLSNEGLQEFSENKNVFVFILDYMDYDYVATVYEEDPAFFDDFDGFTGYTNAISEFGRTRPSLNNILTGYSEGAYLEPSNDFLEKAWKAQPSNILDVLKEKGYTIETYTTMYDLFSYGKTAANYVSNLAEKDADVITVIPGMMLKKLMYLSAYRYAPTAIKPFFWEYTSFYNEDVCYYTAKTDDSSVPKAELYSMDNPSVLGMLMEGTANRTENCFKLYHIDGAHPPCYLNRNGEQVGTMTASSEQTRGCLHLLKAVFTQMKELGIYEDATIIMTADHGEAPKMWFDDFSGMQIAFFYKPSGSAEIPLVWSDAQVSTSNIVPTIAKAVGAESAGFGVALDDIGDEMHERVFYRIYGENFSEEYLDTYHILGDARDFSNWKLVDTQEVLYSFY